jgi:hypothetical protein
LRVLVVLLFVFQVHYVRFHLAAEFHHDSFQSAAGLAALHHDGHEHGDHHDSDHHQPHAVSDHLLQMAAKHQTSLLAIDFLAAEICFCLTPPDAQDICLVVERDKAPGESPPDPLQPRAPPLA